MPSDAHPRRSFLTATLVSCIFYCCGAFANTVIVDDQHPGLVWDGAWEEFTGQQEAEDGTLTWANRTGPTVTFTFTGTSVQVYGAFKPIGTWNIQSLYAIDGGKQTAFVPSPLVPQESSKQKFYDSGPLPLGTHTLKITNLGVQLWIDYFVYDDGGGSGQSTSGSLTAASTDRIGGTKTTTPAARPSSSSVAGITASSSSSGIGSTESRAIVPSMSLGVVTFSQLSTTVSATGTLLTPDAASVSVLTLPQPSSPPISSSSNVTVTPGGSQTPRPNTHGMPRGALVGLIVGAAIVVVAVVAVLIRLRRRHLRRTPNEVKVSQYPFVQPAEDHRTGTRHGSRESRSSKTLTVGSLPGPKSLQIVDRRSESSDRGVSLAAGPHAVDVDASVGLVSDAASEESTPPPSYREFEHGAP